MRARRLDILDLYVEGDEAVVFVNGLVATLSPLATTVLLSIGTTWTQPTVVAGALISKFGVPPTGADALSSTHSTLESLAALGILELEQPAVGPNSDKVDHAETLN